MVSNPTQLSLNSGNAQLDDLFALLPTEESTQLLYESFLDRADVCLHVGSFSALHFSLHQRLPLPPSPETNPLQIDRSCILGRWAKIS